MVSALRKWEKSGSVPVPVALEMKYVLHPSGGTDA